MTKLGTLHRAAALAVAALFLSPSVMAADLSFWSWRQEDKAVYEELIADFNVTHPDINITYEAFESQNYLTVLSTALAGGTGPDIIHVRAYGSLESLAKPGYLRALGEGDVDLAGFSDLAISAETMRDDGQLYAVPFASQTLVIYYNADIFAEHGLTPPETWDELLTTSQALLDAGVTPFANGTATAWQNEILVGTLVPAFYGQQFEADIVAGDATFEDPRFVGALDKLLEITGFLPRGFTGIDYASAQQLFLGGRAAMFAGGSWEIANFRRQQPDLNFDLFASPATTEGEARLVSTFFDGGYAVNAASEHQEEAMEFLRFTATADFGNTLVEKLGNISPIPGVSIDDPLLSKVAAYNRNSVSYIMLVHFRYEQPSGSTLLQENVQRMMAGQATPAEVGKAVTEGIATYHQPFQQ